MVFNFDVNWLARLRLSIWILRCTSIHRVVHHARLRRLLPIPHKRVCLPRSLPDRSISFIALGVLMRFRVLLSIRLRHDAASNNPERTGVLALPRVLVIIGLLNGIELVIHAFHGASMLAVVDGHMHDLALLSRHLSAILLHCLVVGHVCVLA